LDEAAVADRWFRNGSAREYTIKQYKGGPSNGTSMKQNQNTFANADEVSNVNRKYSIATRVIAVPRTPRIRNSLRKGSSASGMGGMTFSDINVRRNRSVIVAEPR
jgi:hypothetical protein